jgi:hypothetical protein
MARPGAQSRGAAVAAVEEARPSPPLPFLDAEEASVMPWAMAVGAEVDERFLVRDLVWCGPCGLSLSALVMSPGRWFYGCRNIHCPRPVIPAEMLEVLVWQAFLYLFAEPDPEISAVDQRAALVHSLERVTVGVDLSDVRYCWRDQP